MALQRACTIRQRTVFVVYCWSGSVRCGLPFMQEVLPDAAVKGRLVSVDAVSGESRKFRLVCGALRSVSDSAPSC
jgi:hypothetical protein